MSQGKTFPVAKAKPVAQTVAKLLLDDSLRCCIVGSLRRCHVEVGDIDLIVTDCQAFQTNWMLSSPEWIVEKNGPKYKRAIVQKIPIDIYIAQDAVQFAMLKLVRTGSVKHNIKCVQAAKAKGLEFKVSDGIYKNGQRLNLVTEELIFQALGMDYVSPSDREIGPPARRATA